MVDEGVVFVTPNHLQEQLYSVKTKNFVCFSNSLAFLLERCCLSLDPNFFRYEEILCGGLFGVRSTLKNAPLLNGETLRIFRCACVTVRSDLSVSECRKVSGLSFSGYQDYSETVRGVLRKIAENATDPAREHKYGMLSTISRGYDAVATSALAREIGCQTVLTFNAPESFRGDCGTEIAKMLGFEKIIEGDANLYKKNETFLEAEACASGDIGSAIVFSAFEYLSSGNLLFMGVRGDSVWERLHENVNDNYDFSCGNGFAQSDSSFGENFLKNNIVGIFPPLIGADHWSQIAKISQSEEMRDFSLRDNYDRPIPRKIAEERGVARSEFGQAKKGAGIAYHFDVLSSLKNKMSSGSYAALIDFSKQLRRNRFKYWCYCLQFLYSEYPAYLNWAFSRIGVPVRIKQKSSFLSSPISSLLILWGVSEMRKRYSIHKSS